MTESNSRRRARNENLEMPIYFLKAKERCIVRKWINIDVYITYIDKCRYEIQKEKGVPVWYTGIYRPI
jgi:hypothetical protein